MHFKGRTIYLLIVNVFVRQSDVCIFCLIGKMVMLFSVNFEARFIKIFVSNNVLRKKNIKRFQNTIKLKSDLAKSKTNSEERPFLLK